MSKANDWGDAPANENQQPATAAPARVPTQAAVTLAGMKQIEAKTDEDVKRNAEPVVVLNDEATIAGVIPRHSNDLAACFDELRQLRFQRDAIPQIKANRETIARVRIQISALEKHIAALQHGAPAPVVDSNAVRHAEREHVSTACTQRTARIEKLALAKLAVHDHRRFDRPSHRNVDPRTLAPRDVVLTFKGIKKLLADAVAAAIDLEAATLKAFPVSHPAERITELKLELPHATADEAVEIQNELARLRSPEAGDVAARTKRTLHPLQDAYRKAVEVLRGKCVADLRVCLGDAIDAEKFFFANFALARSETPVSGRYKQAIHELETMTVNAQSLHWWGVRDVGSPFLWALAENSKLPLE